MIEYNEQTWGSINYNRLNILEVIYEILLLDNYYRKYIRGL